jgi:nucleotide-binding universal stress UspA family protein
MSIVAAADGKQTSARVVEVAGDLASAYGDELMVVHVPPDEEFERRREARDEYLSNHAIADAANVAREVVGDVLEEYYEVSTVGGIGSPTEEIIDVAKDHDASYLVIGGRRRSPVGKAMFGSVSQAVLLHADRPVVTVAAPVHSSITHYSRASRRVTTALTRRQTIRPAYATA